MIKGAALEIRLVGTMFLSSAIIISIRITIIPLIVTHADRAFATKIKKKSHQLLKQPMGLLLQYY